MFDLAIFYLFALPSVMCSPAPWYLGPLGGSCKEFGLATTKTGFSPAHDLESALSNIPMGSQISLARIF